MVSPSIFTEVIQPLCHQAVKSQTAFYYIYTPPSLLVPHHTTPTSIHNTDVKLIDSAAEDHHQSKNCHHSSSKIPKRHCGKPLRNSINISVLVYTLDLGFALGEFQLCPPVSYLSDVAIQVNIFELGHTFLQFIQALGLSDSLLLCASHSQTPVWW